LVTSFLTNLPVELGHSHGGTSSSHEGDRAISNLEFTRVFQNSDLSGERLNSVDGRVRLEDHDITNTRHVLLLETLNVESTVVTRDGLRDRLVVHFNGENLSVARSGSSVGGKEDYFFTRLDGSLFDTSSQHVSNTLDLVDSRDGSSSWGSGGSFRNGHELLEAIKEGVNMDSDLSLLDISTLPPGHVGGLGDQVISLPAGDGEERNGVGNEVLQPSDTEQHTFHLFLDFGVSSFLVSGKIGIHLVDTNKQLLDTEQIDQ
jgi:hypothetical protein